MLQVQQLEKWSNKRQRNFDHFVWTIRKERINKLIAWNLFFKLIFFSAEILFRCRHYKVSKFFIFSNSFLFFRGKKGAAGNLSFLLWPVIFDNRFPVFAQAFTKDTASSLINIQSRQALKINNCSFPAGINYLLGKASIFKDT